jgi:HSP90 family molecular chaperone
MKQDQPAKTYEFKAEIKQLLDILVHSLVYQQGNIPARTGFECF